MEDMIKKDDGFLSPGRSVFVACHISARSLCIVSYKLLSSTVVMTKIYKKERTRERRRQTRLMYKEYLLNLYKRLKEKAR